MKTNIPKKIIYAILLVFILSSFISVFTYADDEVYFECDNLRAALIDIIGHENITISDMEGIEGKLDLSYKNITSVVGLEYLTNVEVLILSQNDIEDISPIVGLSNLISLYVDNNWLKSLPNEKTSWQNLEHLDVSNNEITDISSQFLDMDSLRRLYMGNLPLLQSPDLIQLADTLDRLDISGTGLYDYTFIEGLTSLELLMINDCGLSDLPNLSNMKSLSYLYFTDNNISVLPEYLGYLPLVRLDFSGNLVYSLPLSFGSLLNLEQLVFTDNYFTELPQIVTQMQSLEVLMCGQNLIDTVPDDMYRLENIKRASFAANRLTSLYSFVDFSIPYSYQISFDYNYIDLNDQTNINVLAGYHNDGGTQRQSQLFANVVSATTDAVTFEYGFDGNISPWIYENAQQYELLVFKKDGDNLTLSERISLGDDSEHSAITFSPNNTGTVSYMVCLVKRIDSWPPVKLKYMTYLNDVQLTEPVYTPSPQPTQVQAATATPQPTEQITQSNGSDIDKILLYILIIGVIMIVMAVVIFVTSNKKQNRKARR